MNKFTLQQTFLIFWVVASVDLLAILSGFTWLRYIAKPLLMPALIVSLLSFGIPYSTRKFIITGLFFSWIGDIFLLIENFHAFYFIPGLLSFLITHACYIFFFLSIKSVAPSLLNKKPLYFILVVSYGIGLVWLLLPYLEKLKIPVILYSAVICSMLLCSLHVYLKVKKPANRNFVSGAILFVMSDSILAINRFYYPLPLAGFWIMASYCAAQYFIVRGVVRNQDEKIEYKIREL